MHGTCRDAITRLRSQPTRLNANLRGALSQRTNILHALLLDRTRLLRGAHYSTRSNHQLLTISPHRRRRHTRRMESSRPQHSVPVQHRCSRAHQNYMHQGLSRTSNTYDDTILARIAVSCEPYDLRCPQNECNRNDVDSSNYINRIQSIAACTATTHVRLQRLVHRNFTAIRYSIFLGRIHRSQLTELARETPISLRQHQPTPTPQIWRSATTPLLRAAPSHALKIMAVRTHRSAATVCENTPRITLPQQRLPFAVPQASRHALVQVWGRNLRSLGR